MKNDWHTFTIWLPNRLKSPLPGFSAQKNMMPEGRPQPDPPPENARKCAVLLLLYPNPQNNDIELVLIQRSEDGGAHSGQIAFPGGKAEPFDDSLESTALREAEEEVALDPKNIAVCGRLSPIYIPVSNFTVHPIAATATEQPTLHPSDREVASILFFSFRQTFPNKEMARRMPLRRPGFSRVVPAYRLFDNKIIWGATAMILSELETLWQEFQTTVLEKDRDADSVPWQTHKGGASGAAT